MSDEHDIYLDGQLFADLSMTWHDACTLCFSNDDLYRRKIKDAHPVVREKVLEWCDDANDEIVYLLSPADKVRRRMHIQGYTDERCLALWEHEYSRHIARLEEMRDRHGFDLSEDIADQKDLTFESWLERKNALPLDHWIGRGRGRVSEFDLNDMFASLALEIQYFKPEQVWTELCSETDDFDPNQTFHQNFARLQTFDETDQDYIHATGNILILTEGRSDTNILSAAIDAMYPEYAGLFQFVDFEGFSISGGASMLTKMIKTFAGVRMKQPILALFDNDAAGIAEQRHVGKIRALPPNIKAMVLPEIELAQNYPTIGPEGLRCMNVNGAASSIELFLGKEALTDQNGKLHPIRWTEWHSQSERYQGALEHKNSVTQRFLSRMKTSAEPAELRAEFTDMDQLLNAIFQAFH